MTAEPDLDYLTARVTRIAHELLTVVHEARPVAPGDVAALEAQLLDAREDFDAVLDRVCPRRPTPLIVRPHHVRRYAADLWATPARDFREALTDLAYSLLAVARDTLRRTR